LEPHKTALAIAWHKGPAANGRGQQFDYTLVIKNGLLDVAGQFST